MRPTTSPEWVQRLDRLHLLTPLRVLAVIVVAILLTVIIRRVVAKALREVFERAVAGDRPRAEARYRALSSALRAAVVGVVWAIAVITIVSEVGINIGAFIAGATVIGGAVAFGSQTLIRDVIAGFFVLADDQYGVGDDVDLGHATGTVERVTLRTAMVRDGEGRVWYVPHGNVLRVANLSKASVALLDVDLARETPVDAALSATGRLVTDLAADAHAAALLTSLPVVVGIVAVTDERITVRASASTTIGTRDEVTRLWWAITLRHFETGAIARPVPFAIPPAGPSQPPRTGP
jgi:moderate conductance mechanosensitive channel